MRSNVDPREKISAALWKIFVVVPCQAVMVLDANHGFHEHESLVERGWREVPFLDALNKVGFPGTDGHRGGLSWCG